jgi:mono/diheme cytochrome c family protein
MMEHSVRLRAGGIKVPENLNSQNNLDIGFEHYDAMCVMCHGGPGVPRDDIGQGIVPLPPLLTESADDWTAGQVYWIVRHGIKMAGMPAFGPTHSDEKLWAMTAFVKQLPSITAEQYQQLKKTHPAGSEEQQQESE